MGTDQGCYVVASMLGTSAHAHSAQALSDVAGAASHLKCTSEEFLFSFRECQERTFQWFCLCEEKSVVGLFFLGAGEESHLQGVNGKSDGVGWGGAVQAGQNPGWGWVAGARLPGSREWPPALGSPEGAAPHWPGPTELGARVPVGWSLPERTEVCFSQAPCGGSACRDSVQTLWPGSNGQL